MNPLTEREREVLDLALFTNHEIARFLGISRHTVRNHFSNIYRKLGLTGPGRKRTKALMLAIKHGYIRLKGDKSWKSS